MRCVRVLALVVAVTGVVTLTACKSKQRGKLQTTELEQGIGPGQLTPAQIGGEVQGFADSYVTMLMNASDQLFETQLSPHERALLNGLLLQTAWGVYTIASDANSVVSLLDMIVVVTLTRMVAEEGLARYLDEDSVQLIRLARLGEQEVWKIAEQVLTEDEQHGMRAMIDEWRQANPAARQVAYIRFADFAESRRQMHATTRGAQSLLGLFALDPLANLDPTTAEIERSRLLAERAFYFAKRVPILMMGSATQVYFDIAATDEAEILRTNIQMVADVADRLATSTEQAPEELAMRVAAERREALEQVEQIIGAQREAAIAQIAETVRAEREAFVASIEEEEPRIQALLTELRQTVQATTQLVEALNVLVPETPPDRQREPVDIADVRAVVEQTTLAAENLNSLVQSVDRALAPDDLETRLTQLDLALGRAEARGQSLIDRTFILAGLLVVLIFGASMVKWAVQRRAEKAA